MDFDLEDLVNVEQTFYDDGYKDGFAHGRIHGLIEGRALGREKGFEIWEEIGFYEGFAMMWQTICQNSATQDERKSNHIKHLLELIAQFPRVNPSATGDSDADIPKLFRQIRSRYKLLCAALGIKPSLRGGGSSPPHEDTDIAEDTAKDGQKERNNVWTYQDPGRQAPGGDLSF